MTTAMVVCFRASSHSNSQDVNLSLSVLVLQEIPDVTFSSIFDLRRNSNAQNKFGTVRTVTTEATSLGSEVPSFTRTEASSLAASLAEEMGRRRSTSTEGTRISDRKPSEPRQSQRASD